MTKTTKTTACLLVLLFIAGTAVAQTFSLGVGAQYWNGRDLDEFDGNGMWGGNLILRFSPVKYLGIDLRAGASGVWDGESYRIDGQKYKTDVIFSCLPFEAGLLLLLPVNDRVTFYGGPGVGYYHYDLDIKTSSKHNHHYHSEHTDHIKLEDDVGWYAVAGMTIKVSHHFSVFGEARYTASETKLKHDKSAKIDCSGAGGQVGIMFDF
jgi:opacity protein-like surface antigen